MVHYRLDFRWHFRNYISRIYDRNTMKPNKSLIGKIITAAVWDTYGNYKVCDFIETEDRVLLQRMEGPIGREFIKPLLGEVR